MRQAVIMRPENSVRILAERDLRKLALDEGKRRNRSNLPSFLPLPFMKMGKLPFELLNEPYAFIDTKDRPEVVIPRSAFLFKVDEYSRVAVRVSGELLQIGGRRAGNKLQKSTTNVSVITVYDTYGIEIAYAYLHYLYYYKYDAVFRSWLETYLLASLAVLQRDALNEVPHVNMDVLYICSRIMLELMNLESKQPKMLGEMVPGMTLPPELISKITGSQRISEEIAVGVRAVKCNVIPEMDELLVANDISNAETTWIDSEYSHRNMNWQLTREEDSFILFSISGADNDPNSRIAQFSLHDYALVFRTRGCNADDSVATMLQELLKKFSTITEQNVEEVSAWIVQLSSDTNVGQPRTFYNLRELGDEFRRLVSVALKLRWM